MPAEWHAIKPSVMHLRALKVYCDIVDRRSFSRAAAENRMSQSAASQVVQQLEERLGVQLLDRSRRPFVLTPEGRRYHEGCRLLLRQYADLEQRVLHLHDELAGCVKVAAIYSVGLARMSRYVQEFSTRHPKANVRLAYLHPEMVDEAVQQGDADIGLVSYPQPSRTLATIRWRSEPMVLVCPPSHPLARRHKTSLEALRGEQFIAFQRGLRIRDEIDQALALRHVEVTTVLEFDNIETIKRAIEAGSGVSVLPEPTVEREAAGGTLVTRPLAGQQLSRPLGIIHLRSRPLSDAAEQFVELLREAAAEGCGSAPDAPVAAAPIS